MKRSVVIVIVDKRRNEEESRLTDPRTESEKEDPKINGVSSVMNTDVSGKEHLSLVGREMKPPLLREPMSRRQLLGRGAKLAGAVALAGAIPEILAACGSGASASSSSSAAASSSGSLPNVNLQLVYLENVQFAGSFFAEVKGYYKDAGVNVTLLPGGPNLAPEPIVQSGRALVGITHTAEAVQAIINGADLKIIGAGFQKSPTCIASRASAPIRNPQEMIGKKIGVSASNEPIWTSFLKANNISPSEINVVTVGFDPTPLATGEIDGLVAFYTNEPIVLRLKGVPTYAFLLNDFNYPTVDDIYICKASNLSDTTLRKQIIGVMTGESRGWSDVVANPDEAASLAVNVFGKSLKLDPEQQKLDAQEQNQFVADATTAKHGLFWMTPEVIDGTIRSLAIGNVDAKPSMFTNEILDAIYHGGSKA